MNMKSVVLVSLVSLCLNPVLAMPAPLPGSLLESVRQSCQEEKSGEALALVEHASQLIEQGADVKAAGPQGLTPLHWTVIADMDKTHEQLRAAYLDLAEKLLSGGADVNAEDEFGNTPLDWQEVSSNADLIELLLESGARHGYYRSDAVRMRVLMDEVRAAAAMDDMPAVKKLVRADLPSGTELQVRLVTPVSSNRSRAGDVVQAVVTAPVLVEEREVIAPGTRVRGVVMLAKRAQNDYLRAQIVLSFPILVGPNGETKIPSSLAAVDNARETVQMGRVLGIPHPQANRIFWGIKTAASASDPIAGYALQAASFTYQKEYRREIVFGEGTDLTLRVTAPVQLRATAARSSWPLSPTSPGLAALVNAQPLRTGTRDNKPADLVNIMFLGSQEKLEAAFENAGWTEAHRRGPTADFKDFVALAEDKGYSQAPISTLLLDGEEPALVYQKQNDTIAKRHHVRIWKTPASFEGQEVWVGSATHDIAIALLTHTHWIHRIDSRIDLERSKIGTDLLFTGIANRHSLVLRPNVPTTTENATGDSITTDGKMLVLFLSGTPAPAGN